MNHQNRFKKYIKYNIVSDNMFTINQYKKQEGVHYGICIPRINRGRYQVFREF